MRRLKCGVCDIVWELENIPEKSEENNQFSNAHIASHKPIELRFGQYWWNDIVPKVPPQNGLLEDLQNPSPEVNEPPVDGTVIAPDEVE